MAGFGGSVDWYEALGVEPSASQEHIKKAYRTLGESQPPSLSLVILSLLTYLSLAIFLSCV